MTRKIYSVAYLRGQRNAPVSTRSPSRPWRLPANMMVTFTSGNAAAAAQVVDLENGPGEDRTPNSLIKRCGAGETDATQDMSSLWNLDEME